MTEASASADFDTPERAERLHLVAHLVHNAALIPYVRGAAGAGKTRFLAKLAAALQAQAAVAVINGATPDIPTAVCDALGADVARWPDVLSDAASPHSPVVLVDEADRLSPPGAAELLSLQARGARLVLSGETLPAGVWEQVPIQLVDLPPFTEEQARDFLAATGSADAALWDGPRLRALHQATGGLPGPLLDAASRPPAAAGGAWKWLLGGAAAGLVVLVLWQQERINALFTPAMPPPSDTPAVTADQEPESAQMPAVVAANRIPIPPLPEAPAALAPVPEAAQAPSSPTLAVTAEPGQQVPEPAEAPVSVPAEAPLDGADGEPDTPAVAVEQPPTPPVALEEPAPSREPIAEATEAAAAPTAVARVQPESPSVPESEPEPQEAHEPAARPEPQPLAEAAPDASSAADRGLAWLRSREGGHYTLQLLGARDRDAIDAFIRRHGLTGKYAVFSRDLEGKPWYSLVYGDYPDRAAALRGRDALPVALRNVRAWPRTFASVWKQLPVADGPR